MREAWELALLPQVPAQPTDTVHRLPADLVFSQLAGGCHQKEVIPEVH